MHYAKGIDTVSIGDYYGEDGSGWGSIRENAQSNALLMLLQSLPETARKPYNGTSSFVKRVKYFAGEEPDKQILDGKGAIISINPAPSMSQEIRQILADKACEKIDPERFKTDQETIARTEAVVKEVTDRIESKRLELAEQSKSNDNPRELIQEFQDYRDEQEQYICTPKHEIAKIRRQREHSYNGGFNSFQAAFKDEEKAWTLEQAKTIEQLLLEGGIEFRPATANHPFIQLDQTQAGFDEKLSALMDTHRSEILEKYKDVKFIITKPDGTALDKEQAASIIAERGAALEADRTALDAIARKYDVTRIVTAKLSPRTGRSRAIGGDEASDD